MESVSIVLLYYHRDPSLMPDNYDPNMMRDCVDSIVANTSNCELIAIDNGSTVNEDWIKDIAHVYHRFEKNEGISNGWNKGISLASYENIIILGDDTVVPPNWTEEMKKAMNMPQAGLATVHVEGMPYGEGIQENLRWFPGACFMLTKSLVEKVGYFDWTRFNPCNFEDTDYQVRVMAHGYKLYTNYAVTVQHRMGATLHVKDLSEPFEEMGRRFEKKHGFNGQKYMYQDGNIKEVLHLVDKTKIPINSML